MTRSVLVADGHHLFRRGFANLIQLAFAERVDVLEAETFGEACEILEASDDVELVICDLDMPDADSFRGMAKIVELAGGKPVVVLAEANDLAAVRQALTCGIKGYLLKSERIQQLRLALEMIMVGGTYIPAAALCHPIPSRHQVPVVNRMAERASEEAAAPEPRIRFTDREVAVLENIMQGISNKEIARSLSIAESTVKIHVRSICRKSLSRNRTQAALFARTYFTNLEAKERGARAKLINLYPSDRTVQ